MNRLRLGQVFPSFLNFWSTITIFYKLPASQCASSAHRTFGGVQMLPSDAGSQSLLALAIVLRCDFPDHAVVQKQSVSRSACLFQCEISRFLSNLQPLRSFLCLPPTHQGHRGCRGDSLTTEPYPCGKATIGKFNPLAYFLHILYAMAPMHPTTVILHVRFLTGIVEEVKQAERCTTISWSTSHRHLQ